MLGTWSYIWQLALLCYWILKNERWEEPARPRCLNGWRIASHPLSSHAFANYRNDQKIPVELDYYDFHYRYNDSSPMTLFRWQNSSLASVVSKLVWAVTQITIAILSYWPQCLYRMKNATNILASVFFSLLFSKFI